MFCRGEKSQIVWEIPRVKGAFFISFTSSCVKYGAIAPLVMQDDFVLAHLYIILGEALGGPQRLGGRCEQPTQLSF